MRTSPPSMRPSMVGAASREPGAIPFLLLMLCAIGIASPLHDPLNNPNEGVRVFTVKALVEEHRFEIDDVVSQWGYIDDKAMRDGHLYSSKAPLCSMLGALGYAAVHPFSGDLSRPALTRVARTAGTTLPSLLCAVIWLIGLRRLVSAVVADVVVASLVLGSSVLAYLHVMSGHALAALAIGAAVSWACAPATARTAALVGALLSAAACAEYPAALAIPAVLALVVAGVPGTAARARVLLAAGVGAAPIVVATAVAHTMMFGAPWRTGYSFLENAHYRPLVQGTLFGIGLPDVRVLATVLWSPELGLFFYAPILLVGLAWLPGAWRRRADAPLARVVVVAMALFLLFIAGFRGWRGGWSVGPRYVSELIGILGVPVALAIERRIRVDPRTTWIVVGALTGVGVLHSGIAGLFYPHLSDVFRNPVYEFMLPALVRGMSPASVPLLLGASSTTSAWLVALFPFIVLAAVAARHGAGLSRAFVFGMIGGTSFLVVVGPLLTTGSRAASALEARRLFDNWRPTRGVAFVDEPGALQDARTLVALGRVHAAAPLLARSCVPQVRRGAHGDLHDAMHDALREASARVPEDALLVVPDAFADRLGALPTGPVAVVAADLDVIARAMRAANDDDGMPCAQTWWLAGADDARPSVLARFVDAGAALEVRARGRTWRLHHLVAAGPSTTEHAR